MQSLQPNLVWFSGSGARLASHLGAACALEEMGILAKEYAGISGGAIVATFAAMGKAREVADKLLSITASDVFFPNIFREDGSISLLKSLLGLAITRGRGLCYLRIAELLKDAMGDAEGLPRAKAWLLAYNHVKKDVVKIPVVGSAPLALMPFWAEVLEMQSCFPVLNSVGDLSDAGVTVHYPSDYVDPDETDIYFSVGGQMGGNDNIGGRMLEILGRTAQANIENQILPVGKYITLPALNGHTEYSPAKMRESFEAAKQHVLNELGYCLLEVRFRHATI